jgi:hypothetical protein
MQEINPENFFLLIPKKCDRKHFVKLSLCDKMRKIGTSRKGCELWRPMYVIKEPLAEEQVVCWNCEELVHESALQCPYCNIELHKHQLEKPVTTASTKITPITPYTPTPNEQQQSIPKSGSTFSFICSLFLFLGGSAFLFLSAMVFFFAQDGFFTICWPQHTWSAFLGLGMAAVAFGTLFFQRVCGPSEN